MNKVVKYRYLFPKNLSDGDALQTAVSAAIVDYNDHRPHGSLYGLTPTEAGACPERSRRNGLDKSTLLTFEKLKEAQKARIEHNKKSRCQKCKD